MSTLADTGTSETTAATIGAPYSTGATLALLLLSAGLYLPFWMYRIARDVSVVTRMPRRAWGYPFALLLAPVAAILIARAVRDCAAATPPSRPAPKYSPGLCGWLAFLGLASASALPELLDAQSWTIVAVLVLAFALLPAEHEIGSTRLAHDLPRRRTWGHFAPWQWILPLVGVPIWITLGYLVVDTDLPRWRGEALVAGSATRVVDERFLITAPSDAWVRLGPAAGDDAVERLAGPGFSSADFYVYGDMTAEAVVAERRDAFEASMTDPACEERRTYDDAHAVVIAELTCNGRVVGSPTRYITRVLDDGETSTEVLGYATSENARQLRSLDDVSRLVESFERAP